MLSGLKFIPREQLGKAGDEDVEDSQRQETKRKGKEKRKKSSSRYNSSDEDGHGKIKKNSRKKKWYSSDEDSTSASESGSESESDSDANEKSQRHRETGKKSNRNSPKIKTKDKSREKSRSKRSDNEEESNSPNKNNILRKELGLDWMLRPKDEVERKIATPTDQLVEPKAEALIPLIKKENPRELNPYFKDSGTGYPEDVDESKARWGRLVSSAVVGDGGASWRLKALKRAQEQAAREGRNLNEVVEERWGSVGQLSVSVASRKAAPSRAHLHAIRNRKKGVAEEQTDADDQTAKGSGGARRYDSQRINADDQNEKVSEKGSGGGSQYGVSRRHSEAKVPKVQDSLSWGKPRSHTMSSENSKPSSNAVSSINTFANDGSFKREVTREQNDGPVLSFSKNFESKIETELVSSESRQPSESTGVLVEGLSANQLAAKALQLRLKGNLEEADRLMKEVENIKAKVVADDESRRPQKESHARRYTTHETSLRQRRNEDDGDSHLAQKIAQNKKYSTSTQADDEYDYDDGPRKKSRKKGGNVSGSNEKATFPKRILIQQERCKFCFENPNRPKHLLLAIASFTYLSLPHWQSIVPGHCCILTLQHESATRAVDDNVWDEIRNFKKCLIMMFAKQEMDVVFLETVMGLAQQKRHCMVEVIPLPRSTANAAPLYFKKAIDEAEDEWSQHNAKKLIDTSQKGLRGSIPKDFPYFHVEFGLNRGFVHVIDDETQFKSNFGVNVIRGMLQLAEEDMYGRTKPDSVESQKQAVVKFAKEWEPFNWTKQL